MNATPPAAPVLPLCLRCGDDALASFSLAYADQTERDYELLVNAAQSGRIEIAQGRAP